jgi:hypothetical protein
LTAQLVSKTVTVFFPVFFLFLKDDYSAFLRRIIAEGRGDG